MYSSDPSKTMNIKDTKIKNDGYKVNGGIMNKNENATFYNWLLNNTNYVRDYDMLIKIYDMFDLTNNHPNYLGLVRMNNLD